jgi:homoserine dehydrogenase
MTQYKLALLGFGNVGQALARLLLGKRKELADRYEIEFTVTGIATGSHGRAIDAEGIDLDAALAAMQKGSSLDELSTNSIATSIEFIEGCGADVFFENTAVSYVDGQPALDHLRRALELGMHSITANKGPVVFGYRELSDLAEKKGKKFLFESTVMDGAPVFSVFREALPAANVRSFRGILNSTTNSILSQMEEGQSLEEAIAYAQSIGIAETDPSGDVEGWDAAIKVSALATVLMDSPIKPDEVERKGIEDFTPEMISQAKAEGKRWKLICSAKREGDKVLAKVAPEMVGAESAFYSIEGTTSMVSFESDVLGELSLIEKNPGPETTAYGLLADFVNAVSQ